MGFVEFVDGIRSQADAFLQNHVLVVVVMAFIAVCAIYLRPKKFLMFVLVAVLLVGLVYGLFYLSSAGVSQKKRLIEKSSTPDVELSLPLQRGL